MPARHRRHARPTSPRPIVVIGSINMDLVCRTPRVPRPGETVLGSDLATIPGGKGANQAVAAARLRSPQAARLGGRVYMVGGVGDDDLGRRLLAGLCENGVNTDHVYVTAGAASGCAMILVDRRGENSIVVAPGANARVTPADVDAAVPLLRSAAVVVLQLEIPIATVRHVVAMCRRLGVPTILDPAPVPEAGLPAALFRVDVLTPNQPEAALLTGHVPTGRAPTARPEQTGKNLLSRGPSIVVLKLGARGSMVVGRDGTLLRARPPKVRVAHSTAAGDAFTGALAVAMSEGMGMEQALRFANAAGALCCTKFGAQPALPHRDAVDRLMQGRRR
jgi:ribokinase